MRKRIMANDKMQYMAPAELTVPRDWNSRSGDWTKVVDPETGEGWEQFLASIKAEGVKVPVEGRMTKAGKIELVSGFRRHLAATQVGLKDIPVIVRELDETQARLANIRENTARQSLKGADLAWALRELVKANPAYGVNGGDTMMANSVGLSQPYVSKLSRIMADVKSGITKQWREATVPVTIREMYALALVPKDKQDAEWEKILKGKTETSTRGRNAWIDTAKKNAEKFGFQLGTLKRLGLIEGVEGEWLDVLDCSIKLPAQKAKLNHRKAICKFLESGFERGMLEPEVEVDDGGEDETAE